MADAKVPSDSPSDTKEIKVADVGEPAASALKSVLNSLYGWSGNLEQNLIIVARQHNNLVENVLKLLKVLDTPECIKTDVEKCTLKVASAKTTSPPDTAPAQSSSS